MSTSAFADSQHPITWPSGFTAAASFTFDVDAESCVIAHDPTSTRRMSLMSHQSYGPKVAVPRLLQILARQEVRGTFFIPGFTAESYPDVVRQIADGGHEVAHHGYLHEPMQGIDAATEASYMDRGLEALEKVAGIRPVGYRAPWWELNWHSPALLADRGFLYDSSLLDGDAPYRMSVASGSPSGAGDTRDIVEIPVDWTLDDWEQYAFYPGVTGSGVIESPAKVLEMWTLEAEAHHSQGSCFVLTNHPFISGRPSKGGGPGAADRAGQGHGRHVGDDAGADRGAHQGDGERGAHPRQDRGSRRARLRRAVRAGAGAGASAQLARLG
jgi:peptidoglycan/xylan/chitin deacetylase (PgdA/CDA1 family)